MSELSPPRPGLRRTPTSGGHGRSGGFGPRRAWARAEVATHPPWTSEGGVCGSSRSDGAEGPGTTAPPLISWKTPVAQEVEKGCNELMGPSFSQRPSLASGGDASSASTPGRGRGFDIELFGLKRVMGRMEAKDGARAGDPGLTTLCCERRAVRGKGVRQLGNPGRGPPKFLRRRSRIPRTNPER